MNNSWKVILISIGAVLALFLIGLFGVQSSQNRAIQLEEAVTETASDIEVQEKRRADLIPNLANCVKQYDAHEAELILAFADARSGATDPAGLTTKLNAVVEKYPDIKSATNYNQLMTELATTENLISKHRKTYNQAVSRYNAHCKKFPTRAFLNWTGYEVQEYEKINYGKKYEDAPVVFGD